MWRHAVTSRDVASYVPRVTGQAEETWNVIALGFDAPDAVVVDGLQRLFGIDYEAAQRLVRSTPRAVKHDVPHELALRYCAALSELGGRYELQPSTDAFLETSAGEHTSPVVRRPHHGVTPDHMEAPGQIGAEYSLGDGAVSGLEIDMARSQRSVRQGNEDPRKQATPIARADYASIPPGASQSLPPPRMTYAMPTSNVPERPAGRGVVLIVLGVALIVGAVIGARSVLIGELAIAVPVLKGVGALFLARGLWARLSK